MLCRGQEAGYSAILGGLVWVLPTLYFAYRVLFADIRKSVKSLVWSFYRAEITKLAFSAMLFVITVKLISVNTLTVLLAFLVAQISFWVASLFYLWLAVR
jgi:ATP synthase protein I